MVSSHYMTIEHLTQISHPRRGHPSGVRNSAIDIVSLTMPCDQCNCAPTYGISVVKLMMIVFIILISQSSQI